MGSMEKRPMFAGLEHGAVEEIFGGIPTPCYIVEEKQLMENGRILSEVSERTGCKILLAQKAFSNYDFYPLLSRYIAGTEASGLYEARLGAEEMPDGEVHVFCAAYRDDEFEELLEYADHIVFNSPNQLKRFGEKAKRAGKSIGLRINPQCSTQAGHEIYDPCAPGSRLGTTRKAWDEQMDEELVNLLDGLHFHTLCEQDADALEITLKAVEEQFGDILPRMKWLNMGGGHHVTRPGYQRKRLEECILQVKNKWKLEVYLEPGEAVALNAGYLVSRVLDVVRNGDTGIAILDASAACHMPDVIEMPYLPPVYGAAAGAEEQDGGAARVEKYQYRLAGPTCLSGDIVGDYTFDRELHVGDLLVFGDMAIYTTCKNNTFNGMPLPDIWKRCADGTLEKLTDFQYEDFKHRLGKEKCRTYVVEELDEY